MMKSFFKKLSLVMALAMVVSLVAPAGSAFAAEAGIAYQDKKTAIEAINAEVGGEVVDLCFLGAPADWKSTFAWTSGDETIASVDRAGKVTGLKAGETTVTITAGADASYKYTVKVTVTEPVAEVTYYQISEIVSKVVFGKAVSFKKEDASLYRIFDTAEGPVEVYWPINTWEVAKDGLSVTFAPFVAFADGDNYVLRVGSYEVPFTTAIGEVTHVFTTYGNNTAANNNVAYITTEDMDDDQVSKLGVQIMSGTIDLTNVYASKYDISYEFVGEEAEHVDLDTDDGEIVVTDKAPFQVTAVLGYEDEEGNDQVVANVLPVTVTPQNVPAYEIVSVEDWAIYKDGDFSWANKSVPAGDEGYNLVVKLKDSYGNYWVNNNKAAQSWNKIYNITDESTFAEEGFSIKFFSTNTDKYLVDEDGEVATYEKAKATIYVSLYKDTEEEDDVFVKNIYAFTLDITAAREISGFWSDGSKVDLVVDAMTEWEDEFTTKNFAFMVHDQYYVYWNGTADYEVTTSPEIAEGCGWELWAGANWSQIHLDANKLAEEAGKKTSIKFTIEETNSGEKTSFTVSLKKPDWVGDKTVDEDDVVVGGVDDDMFLETSKALAEVDLGTGDVSLDWNGDVDGWSNPSDVSRTAKIELYKSSNGQHVGYFTHDEITDVITSSEWDEATSGIAKGDVYMAVYNPKGKLITTEAANIGQLVQGDNGHSWYLDLAVADEDGKINYNKDVAGKYTVKVYTVYNVDVKDGEIYDVDYVTETAYFNVTMNQAKITLRDRKGIETTKDIAQLDEIILDCFDFNINGNYWSVETDDNGVNDANMIVDGSWKYTDKGDYIILHSVKVKVPFIGDADLVTGESYYEVEVKGINMSIKFVEE